MKFLREWQNTSIVCDTYHDAWGEALSIVSRKPYIKYYDSEKHGSVAQLVRASA